MFLSIISIINSLDGLIASNLQVWYPTRYTFKVFWLDLHWGRWRSKTDSMRIINSLDGLVSSNRQVWYPTWYTFKNFWFDLHFGGRWISLEADLPDPLQIKVWDERAKSMRKSMRLKKKYEEKYEVLERKSMRKMRKSMRLKKKYEKKY